MATDLSSSASSDTSSSRVHALRVLHWSIPVDDLEESQRFYSEVLGMRFRDRLGSDMVCMACSDPPQNVLLCKRPEPRPTTAETAGPSHYAFVVSPEDFDRAVENLQKWFDRPVLPNTPDRPGHWRRCQGCHLGGSSALPAPLPAASSQPMARRDNADLGLIRTFPPLAKQAVS